MPDNFDSGNPTAPAPNTTAPVAPDADQQQAPSVNPAMAPAAAPAPPAGTQPNPTGAPGSVEPHHGVLMTAFQDIAGGKKTVWRQTDQGPVADKENLQPGEIARNILAAALTGLAGGYSKDAQGRGAGAAMAAGFNANQARTDQNADQAKSQAQDQFKNKTVADELTMRKAADARDQQRSIEATQSHVMSMHIQEQNYTRGQFDAAQDIVKADNAQVDRMNTLAIAGVKPLTFGDGKPVPEFNTAQEAADFASKNPQLAIGKFTTLFETDPNTGKFMIMKKPQGYDDPQWMGVKVGKDGQPVKDKDGNLQPDGTFRDPATGKITVPAGPMTPRQFTDSQIKIADLEDKKITHQEALERLKNMRRENAKNKEMDAADKQWNDANGDPNAIDPKTGQFIMSPTARQLVRQRNMKDMSVLSVAVQSGQKELEMMDPKDPMYNQLKASVQESLQQRSDLQMQSALLSNVPNPADVQATNLRKQYTVNGVYDQDAALKAAPTAPSAQAKRVRDLLSQKAPEPANKPDAQLDTAFNAVMAMPEEKRRTAIESAATYSQADKQRLLSRLSNGGKKEPVYTPTAVSSVSPDMTVVKTATGHTQILPNDSVESFVKNNPGSSVVGQGTKQGQSGPQSDFGSR